MCPYQRTEYRVQEESWVFEHSKKAEKSLDNILKHTIDSFSIELAERTYFEIKLAVSKLSD